MEIKIKKIEKGKLPEYKTEGSAGADCYARLEKEVLIKAGKSETIPLGFAVEIPVGYEMQIRGRSGLARKNNIDCFPGTIDSDYRGEVCAILINKGQEDFIVKPLDRIAQAVIAPVIKAEWYLTENLSVTERGENGFGSTGVESGEIKVSYNHPVEKFYEPFTKSQEMENLLGKEVVIDKIYKGVFNRIESIGLAIKIYFKIFGAEEKGMDIGSVFNHDVEMDCLMAFQRVTIDGHRFGKEMEFEG